ncbi:MAG TPA: hypothetical protein VIL20_29950 [Sandaracinaceae bacterium]
MALVGGRGGFGASLWTNAYFSAFLVAWWPISLLGLIPWVGPVIRLVGYLALEAITAVQLTRAAKRYHGLEGSRAVIAGWSNVLVFVVLGCACGIVGGLLALAAPPTGP